LNANLRRLFPLTLAATVWLTTGVAPAVQAATEAPAGPSDVAALLEAARRHETASGVPLDEERATRGYREAADRGDMQAQLKMGQRAALGFGMAVDHAEALRYYRMAAAQGDREAHHRLSWLLGSHDGEGRRHLEQAAAAGHPDALCSLAERAEDPLQAMALYERAAQQGHVRALEAYENRRAALSREKPDTVTQWRTEAGQGRSEAAFWLGLARTAAGAGDEGQQWLVRAAEAGHGRAAWRLFDLSRQRSLYAADATGRRAADAEGLRWLRRAGELGEPAALLTLGSGHLRGTDGLPKDEALALRWLQAGAKRNLAPAYRDLGLIHKYGLGTPVNLHAALGWLHLALDRGDASAADQIRRFRAGPRGELVVTDPRSQLDAVAAKAAAGDRAAQVRLAEMWLRGENILADEREALVWYRRAAEAGYAPAQLKLAVDMQARLSPGEAERWIEKAARQGLVEAQLTYGQWLARRQPRVPAAVQWLERAGARGHRLAIWAVAGAYEQGDGVPQHLARALAWYLKAAEAGDAGAWVRAGALAELGAGRLPDPKLAATYYARAGDDAEALYRLGRLHARGEGVPRDMGRAATLYGRAVTEGSGEAALALGRMREAGWPGVAPDAAAAWRAYAEAVEIGQDDDIEAELATRLAVMAENGIGTARNGASAVEHYQLADRPEGLLRAAALLDEGRLVPRDPALALSLYRQAVRRLEREREAALSALFDEDWELPSESGREALEALLRAARAGHAGARLDLALLLAGRDGPTLDEAQVHGWVGEAARGGDRLAQAWLAASTDTDPDAEPEAVLARFRVVAASQAATPAGGEADYRRALALAADLENAQAYLPPYPGLWNGIDIGVVNSAEDARALLKREGLSLKTLMARDPRFAQVVEAQRQDPATMERLLLANMFLRKAEFADDEARAMRWLERAAELGSPLARLALGDRHAKRGDAAKAYMWYSLAAAAGHPAGAPRRDRQAAKLSWQPLAGAQADAAAWWARFTPALSP
jgi:TPR repeat protein